MAGERLFRNISPVGLGYQPGLLALRPRRSQGGEILEMIELPFGGICSLQPWRGEGLRRIRACLKEMGPSFDKPIFALICCRS